MKLKNNVKTGKQTVIPLTSTELVDIQARTTAENVVNAATAWLRGRKGTVAEGGYGTSAEQFEILGEQGIGAYQQHIATVKTNHPKP